jgi:hypothetical protein
MIDRLRVLTFNVLTLRIVFDHPIDGVWPSDHFGVLAVLRRREHIPGWWRS